MNQSAQNFFVNGCGRCSLTGTPKCKVHRWQDELAYLREILNSYDELSEDCKWGFPCYTWESKNIALLGAFKEFSSINFFKGVLIKNADEILEKAGPNSFVARLYKATNLASINAQESSIRDFITQAITIEKDQIPLPANPKKDIEIPPELSEKFEEDPAFEEAFFSLTPGRQRGYILYFFGAKQPKTRRSRIEKYTEHIMRGEGMHDEYRKKK